MDFESEILRLAAQNDETIRQLFDDYFNELAAYGVRTPKKDGFFSFEKDLPPKEREAVKELTKDFQEKLYQQIHFGVDVAVGISLAKDVEFLRANFPEGLNIHQPRRKDAREAFVRQRTKPAGRLSLSDRVWNYTNQSKAEAEAAMSLAIEDGVVQGKTAAELGRELRKYLNDPDRMYRRYHKKIVDSTGAKRDVVVWKKRVIGADGQVHFVDADLEKTGQGVCRSARKNAERCSRSEINSAYRYSDYERWNDEEFVLGIKISLSNNHTIKKEVKRGNRHVKINVPFHDICDDLQGIYPKSFKWAGWHPQCRCHATAVTASKEEKMRWLAEGCPKGYFDNQQVKKAPANFVKYIAENKEKIASAKSLPFWVQDNLKLQKAPAGAEKVVNLLGIGMAKPAAMKMPLQKLTPLEVAAQRHAARTPEQARKIQEAWSNRVELNKAIAVAMEKARAVGNDVQSIAEGIAEKYGAKCTPINYKGAKSIRRKVLAERLEENPFCMPEDLGDLVRTTIIGKRADLDSIVAELEKTNGFVRLKRQKTNLGYTGYLINIKTKSGIRAEIQVNTAEMIFAKELPSNAKNILGENVWNKIYKKYHLEGGLGHKFYEEYRVLKDKNSSRALELIRESIEYYKHFSH